jgi:hypothetical protein
MAWNWNEIQSVLKEETFKTWRERTNELIEQQNNFVSWQAAIDSRWYVTDTSSSTTTYTGVTSPGATGTDSLVAGYFIVFRPATNNTGASTLNIASSDGAVDIKKIASGAKVALAADDLDSDNYAELIFDGTDWLMMNAPIDALPTQSGNAGKFLTTDASTASWATLDTDANKTTKGLYEHEHTIDADYSIASGSNAMSAGPITIDSGYSVTIPTGSTWVIV